MQISDSTRLIYKPVELERVVENAILNALAYTGGNRRQAAKLLGVSLRVVIYRLTKMRLK